MSKIPCAVWNKVDKLKYAHAKADGHFTRIRDRKVYSSQGTDLTDKIITLNTEWYKRIPSNCTILGELYYPKKPASYIKSGIANCDPTIRFAAFAIENLAASTPLEVMEKTVLSYNLEFMPYICCEVCDAESLINNILPLLKQETDAILEGFVLKNGNMLNWQKFKIIKTIDVIILGYTHGKNKYEDMIGSIRCGIYNIAHHRIVEIATCGGFTDEIRKWLSNPNNGRPLIGKQVIEVEYQSVGANGRLRFPQFKTWRDDKLAEDCKTDQDLDLLEKWK